MKANLAAFALIATLGLIINCMPTVFVAEHSDGSPAFELNICQSVQIPLYSLSIPVLLSTNQPVRTSTLIPLKYNLTGKIPVSPLLPAAPDPPPPKAPL
jgi:hypothetical protein